MSESHKLLSAYFLKFLRKDKKTAWVSYANSLEGYMEMLLNENVTVQQVRDSINRELNSQPKQEGVIS